MYIISKIRSFLLYGIKVLKKEVLGRNRKESSKYNWEKVGEGLFNGKELFLAEYKIIFNCKKSICERIQYCFSRHAIE